MIFLILFLILFSLFACDSIINANVFPVFYCKNGDRDIESVEI